MNPRILIVNLHSSQNAGDDVLTKITIEQLHIAFLNPEIVLAMNDPSSFSGDERCIGSFNVWVKDDNQKIIKRIIGVYALCISVWVALAYRWRGRYALKLIPVAYRELIKAYLDADLIVSSAGNFFYSSGRFGIAFGLALFTASFAILLGKPLYTMPQTFGPVTRFWERRLLRWLLNKTQKVFVREIISWMELESMGVDMSRCYLVPDIAFVFSPDALHKSQALLSEYGVDRKRPLLGITLIDWGAQNKSFRNQSVYEQAIAQLIRHFVAVYNGQVVLFAQVCGPTDAENDRLPTRRVYASLQDLGTQVVFIDQIVPPQLLRSAYGLMDIFVGTRLHSNIFALSAGTPTIIIQYQYKSAGVAQMIGLNEWVIKIENVNARNSIKLLENLWKQRIPVARKIERAIKIVQANITQISKAIASDYYDQ